MKLFVNILLFFLFITINLSQLNTTEQNIVDLSQESSQLKEIEVVDIIPSEQSVIIVCTDKAEFSKFYLDSPPRVVVDIKNSLLKFGKEEIIVDSKYIKKVRTRQFKTEPQKVVRVVLDLVKKLPYKVEVDNNNNILVSVISPTMKVVNQKNNEIEKTQQESQSQSDIESKVDGEA
ncbi:MAG: AMIN domain-containing protein, partial [Elusimicrobiota bacterium]|nr:AMIN domain-containing protein [Endomicrobiia bacterium]MDW8166318.1 AMIN domain-containing protein [Elusimicrobiota bacterium]